MEYIIQGKTLDEIADTIRKMTGKTDKMLATEFAGEIASITGGVNPTLFAPSIVVDTDTTMLTITDDGNGDFERWYMLYVNGTKVATLSSKTVTLNDTSWSLGINEITVQAAAPNFSPSGFSNSVTWIAPTAGLEYTLSEDGTYATYKSPGTSPSSTIVIDSAYGGVPVTEIGNAAAVFDNVTYMFIPHTVETINDYWYWYSHTCYPNLESIEVDKDNGAYLSTDGVLYTKDGTTILRYPMRKVGTSFVIPSGVGAIHRDAFRGCSGLTSVTIPDGVTNIGNEAFVGCSGLTSVTIPKSVTQICDALNIMGRGVFGECTSLKNINVESDNKVYSSINGNLYSIEGSLVQYACGKTETEFSVPDGVKRIEPYVFDGCENLEKIVVSDSVTSIGCNAFYSESVKIIEIGSGYKNTITSLFHPFGKIKNLKRLDFSKSTQVIGLESSAVFLGAMTDFQIKVPENLFEEWKNATKWSNIANNIVTEFTNTL